jgi:CheY-like chemotaxis protein
MKKVLYIDTDEDDRELFLEIVKRADVEMVLSMAGTGEEALEMLQKPDNRPDVVFVELLLKPMSGAELITAIRGIYEYKMTPIVAYTSANKKEDIERAFKAGASEYILKTTDIDGLAESIRDVLLES